MDVLTKKKGGFMRYSVVGINELGTVIAIHPFRYQSLQHVDGKLRPDEPLMRPAQNEDKTAPSFDASDAALMASKEARQ